VRRGGTGQTGVAPVLHGDHDDAGAGVEEEGLPGRASDVKKRKREN
jgi:hypothetical protein